MIETDELFEMAQEVWSQVLGMDLMLTTPAEIAKKRLPLSGDSNIAAVVQVSGDLDMAVVLTCPSGLARKAAAAMLAMEPEDASPEDVQDAFGELANLVGGGIKNRLPGSNKLSVPSVAEGTRVSLRMAGGQLLSHLWMVCEGDSMQLLVFSKESS